MLTTLAYLAFAAILALVIFVATRPNTFEISRTQRINAAPDRIFPYINNLKSMNTWMPFVKPDPNIELTYSGPESGPGAINDFAGNSQVGAGRVEITQATPPSTVTMRLTMTRPMACDNTVAFTLEPKGAQTDVTWAMRGDQTFVGKLFGLFCNADTMVGGQFEKGLADLKALSEA